MPVLIERLEVQEGFLDGLDLHFTPGLNVLIGSRGSGKTSVIELIRYGLGVPGYTPTTDEKARSHAASVLESGRVTVTLLADGEEVVVTRAAGEDAPRLLVRSFGDKPIILSQGEVERVGLDPTGRLRLVDGFRAGRSETRSQESGLLTRVGSLTVEMADLCEEIAKRREETQALNEYKARLSQAEKTQSELAKKMAGLKNDQTELELLGKAVAASSARETILERNRAALQEWLDGIERLLAFPPVLESWRQPDADDPIRPVSKELGRAQDALRSAASSVQTAINLIEHQRSVGRDDERKNRDLARDLRKKLETAQAGAGRIARDVAELRERVARLEAIGRLIDANNQRLDELQRHRGDVLDDLELVRVAKFEQRVDVAESIASRLGPLINVGVKRFGLHDEYASALANALRGSQLQYNVLAYRIADTMSPREFVEAVESNDTATFAKAADIDEARAIKAIAHLSGRPLHEVLAASLEDAVTLQLFDGEEYRTTERLSTGQRCTVILPIILLHEDRSVLVDQPEDNLDNAFVVDSLVKAITSRRPESQLIFATHNPNVPVLGEAANVVLMGSDGSRGYAEEQGSLADASIVRAITDVMEGGAEAFKLRAAFYANPSER